MDDQDTTKLPHSFNDDEPLPDPPAITAFPNSGLEKISITTNSPYSPEIPASDSRPYFNVNLHIKAPSFPVRAPIDIVVVLDVSRSMSGDKKLSRLQSASQFLIDRMLPSDRLSIITFSTSAERILPLRRMTDICRKGAKCVVDSLQVINDGDKNIVAGLNMGAQVLEQRRRCNPVSIIILLSDGKSEKRPNYLGFLSSSILGGHSNIESQRQRFPVYIFGVGYGHNRIAMEDIAKGSGGAYSYIESSDMIPECIGSVFKIVAQDARVVVTAARGVEIQDIDRHTILRKQRTIYVGDLVSEKWKDFSVLVSVPVYSIARTWEDEEEANWKTPLLDIVCYYRNVLTNERVQVHAPSAEIPRPVNCCCCCCCGAKVRGRRSIWAWFCCWGGMYSCV